MWKKALALVLLTAPLAGCAEPEPTEFQNHAADLTRISTSGRSGNYDSDAADELLLNIKGHKGTDDFESYPFAGSGTIHLQKEKEEFGEEGYENISTYDVSMKPSDFTADISESDAFFEFIFPEDLDEGSYRVKVSLQLSDGRTMEDTNTIYHRQG